MVDDYSAESAAAMIEKMNREDAERVKKRLATTTRLVEILSAEKLSPGEIKQALQATALIMGVAHVGTLDGDLMGSIPGVTPLPWAQPITMQRTR